MKPPLKTPTPWTVLNQRYLYQSVLLLRQQLNQQLAPQSGQPLSESEKHAAQAQTETSKSERQKRQILRDPSWPTEQPPPALTTLCQVFSLSAFDRGILLMCTAVELDPSIAQLYAKLQGNPPRPYPTLNLAIRCLAQAYWNSLTPAAALRYWQLIETTGDEPLTTQALRLDERILHYLMGVSYLDPLLETHVSSLTTQTQLPASQQLLADQMIAEWIPGRGQSPLINLYGGTEASREAIAIAACQTNNFQLYALDVSSLPPTSEQRTHFQRRWAREAVLNNNSLFIAMNGLKTQENAELLTAFVQRQQGRVVLSSHEPLTIGSRPIVRLEVSSLSSQEQKMLWRQALGHNTLDRQLGQVISQFNLDPQGISQVGQRLSENLFEVSEDLISGEPGSPLWEACRQRARITLDDLAQRLKPVATWKDLVLPADQLRTLRAIVASVQQRSQVYEDWGFGRKSDRGLGISALFAGSSGTGKTMSAEVIAQALQLDLYRIDLSSVVSKYIGETEKNLRRIFDAAEQGGVILLFDEADALFGKRSDVKDSHDRHANIEVSYLLQRMETYRGLAILTTNFRNALDSAFLRRLRFVVQFPFPDVSQRMALWQRVFPTQTPTQGLDMTKLARLTVPGGNIYSIAMNAAFLASAEAAPVQMQHLLQAAQSEYTKLNKKLADAEVRGWI